MVSHTILSFKEYGESWAYFERWQKQERKVKFRKRAWENIVKTGAVLAYILSVIKLLEYLKG